VLPGGCIGGKGTGFPIISAPVETVLPEAELVSLGLLTVSEHDVHGVVVLLPSLVT
jgi:hypothetical protein